MTQPSDLQKEIERLADHHELNWRCQAALRELAAWVYWDAVKAVDDAGGDNCDYHMNAIARRAKEVT